jgi:AcrR family transcriptional regulator
MSGEKRPYNKRRRAELEEQTRLRITESAVELHGTVGPVRTTISAVAERAGVRRSTVYRHFPDEAALFAACSSHWAASHPPPDPTPWAAIADPDDRLATALRELYAYYRGTEEMWFNILRDEPLVPVISVPLGGYRAYLDAVRDVLAAGRRRRRRVRAAIGHALAFPTWRSLAREQGLDDDDAAELMRGLVATAA